MSSENQPIRKAWIRHARGLTLRKWGPVVLGVGLIAAASVAVIEHHRKPNPMPATPPVAAVPKPAMKAGMPAAPSSSKAAPSVVSTAPAPPPKSPPELLRSVPSGNKALILVAPLAPSPAPPVQLPPQAPSTSPGSTPMTPAVPELPTVAVASPGFHVVPSERDTKRFGAVTMSERNGHTFTIVPAAPAPRSTPSPSPSAVATAAPPRAEGFAPLMASAVFSGHARAAGPLTLDVQGQTVALFGVKSAEPQDRCAGTNGKPTSCAALAQATLAHKLAGHSIVACRVPPGQHGTLGAICLDEQGNDLGRFLVIEGLALADSAQSYDYLPAEGAARSAHRGLWRFR
ncbi:MAG: hypothetical protein KGJ66_12295 [Alphaproteobacteria bacterium]|nr:hypothetical protein [Alphaproteobacteria bacterium]